MALPATASNLRSDAPLISPTSCGRHEWHPNAKIRVGSAKQMSVVQRNQCSAPFRDPGASLEAEYTTTEPEMYPMVPSASTDAKRNADRLGSSEIGRITNATT
eukprot:Amastigsp_a347120_26.p3 type:complete len:103 gc:universal Amastigsp_a347120_26:885-577(-)